MCNLGLSFLIDKNIKRYERNALMRMSGMNTHYKNNEEQIITDYIKAIKYCKYISSFTKGCAK